jgi:hypothetical protein
LSWIVENKEWLFSGIGVIVITTIIGFIFNKKNPQQSIKSGDCSHNYQGGRDVNINIGDSKNEKK